MSEKYFTYNDLFKMMNFYIEQTGEMPTKLKITRQKLKELQTSFYVDNLELPEIPPEQENVLTIFGMKVIICDGRFTEVE
jgi:hypothetical protein